jgi:uncharacterized membrane protein
VSSSAGTDDGKAASEPAARCGLGAGIAHAGHLEFDRVVFFSDAVFAIAITLLIVDIPSHIGHGQSAVDEIKASERGMAGFAISFAVIGLFWVAHHALFRFITAIDRPLMMLNLLFLGIIAFLPFPTDLLSATANNETASVVFYASCVAAAGLVETVIWVYVTHARVRLTVDVSPQLRHLVFLRTVRVPVVFGLSIPIAIWSPRGAQYFWLAIWLSGAIINRIGRRHGVPAGSAAPPDSSPGEDPAAEPEGMGR